MNKYLVYALIVCIAVAYFLYTENSNLKSDNKRLSENFSEAQKQNLTYKLTKEEFKQLLKEQETRTAKHIDSLLKANKIKIKQVNEVHNITNNYKDTSIVTIEVPKDSIKPFEINSPCLTIRGDISDNMLTIKERYYSNEIDVVNYLIPRKFLFIRTGWKEERTEAFSDCGEVTIKTFRKVKKK